MRLLSYDDGTYRIDRRVDLAGDDRAGGFAVYRVRTRRSHIGSAAAGTIYDIVQDEKRKAIEVVVADKAAARDFEHADDDDE